MNDILLKLIGRRKTKAFFSLNFFLLRISLRWILHNRTYFCPQICSISLYSLIYVSFDDVSLLSSPFLIDSCDLIALYPYSDYLQTRRLIYRG